MKTRYKDIHFEPRALFCSSDGRIFVQGHHPRMVWVCATNKFHEIFGNVVYDGQHKKFIFLELPGKPYKYRKDIGDFLKQLNAEHFKEFNK